MNGCIYLNESNRCDKGTKYGCYCWKHRKNYLLDMNQVIVIENFTHVIKDYTIKELKDYYIKHYLKSGEKKTKLSKEYCFNEIAKHRELINHFSDPVNQNKIVTIQRDFKMKLKKRYESKRGPGYSNRELCNNVEDFYTFEPLKDIKYEFFISYQDAQNHVWGFDIRSLNKLINMNFDNPYTRGKLPETLIQTVHDEIILMESRNVSTSIQSEVINDRKVIIKQRITDLFSQIEFSGYSCSIEWLLDLPIHKLKKLYRNLEDVWNYRANLPLEVKRKLAPPGGMVFVYPVHEVSNYTNKLDILDVITNEVTKFTKAEDMADQKLGFMYFLIGLGQVSHGCYQTHADWLNYT